MKIDETIIYANPDQILGDLWTKWSESVLVNPQLETTSFQQVLASANSNDRSRAADLYNIGVLKGVLVTPQELGRLKPLGWSMLQRGQPIHTSLGYIAYLIGKTNGKDLSKIEHGFSALCAVFCIQLGIRSGDVRLSFAAIFNYIAQFFPKPDDIDVTLWQRYLAAGMFSTLHSYAFENLIENLLNNQPINRLVFRWQDATEEEVDYALFQDYLRVQRSITTLNYPKHSLFFVGKKTDARGVFAQATKQFSDFLKFYAEAEIEELQQGKRGSDCFNYQFLHKNPLEETPDIIAELQKLTRQSPAWGRTIARLMKTLQDGSIEAIYQLYGSEVAQQIPPNPQTPAYPLPDLPRNKILFGAPGTGKSSKIKNEYAKGHITRRVTFHPDYEHGSFVGAYKPVSATNAQTGQKEIQYEFVPQEFTKIYCDAWNNPGQAYFLIIEEINRGNCAQIFGDLFQSLDRNSSHFSEYEVDTDAELAAYLRDFFQKNPIGAERLSHQLVKHGRNSDEYSAIILPDNLYLYATMNTSDQSLFPMDSAFKRRWDWEYIPIDVEPIDKEGNPIEWTIRVGGADYSWAGFLKQINTRIYRAKESEDKQLGFWFVKAVDNQLSEDDFIAKVLFYLWYEVFRNEPEHSVFPALANRNGKDEPFHYGLLFDHDPALRHALLTEIISKVFFPIG